MEMIRIENISALSNSGINLQRLLFPENSTSVHANDVKTNLVQCIVVSQYCHPL